MPIYYLGERGGVESRLIQDLPFFSVPTGKWRRYFSWRNFGDLARVGAGIVKSLFLIAKLKPRVVFAKGGYVSLPVGVAAWIGRVPLVIHESDFSPGLANRILARCADRVCLSFPESRRFFNGSTASKTVCVGPLLRTGILNGNAENGWRFLDWSPQGKPLLLVMGGSSGAADLNRIVQEILPDLQRFFRVVHLTGEGKQGENKDDSHYRSFPYLNAELADIYAITDFVCSRAGAGAVAEICALNLPAVFVPLPRAASRGDQWENAHLLKAAGGALVFDQDEESPADLLRKLTALVQEPHLAAALRRGMKKYVRRHGSGIDAVVEIISGYL